MCNKKTVKKTPLFQEQQKQKVYDTNPCVICQLLAFHEKGAESKWVLEGRELSQNWIRVLMCVMWFQGLVYSADSTFSSGMVLMCVPCDFRVCCVVLILVEVWLCAVVLMCMWCDFRVWLTVLIPMEVGWWRYWSWLDSSPSSTRTPEHMQSILCFWHSKNNGEGKVWFQVWQMKCPHSVVRWLQFVEDSCFIGCLNYGWLTLCKLNSSVLPWNLHWAVGLQTC